MLRHWFRLRPPVDPISTLVYFNLPASNSTRLTASHTVLVVRLSFNQFLTLLSKWWRSSPVSLVSAFAQATATSWSNPVPFSVQTWCSMIPRSMRLRALDSLRVLDVGTLELIGSKQGHSAARDPSYLNYFNTFFFLNWPINLWTQGQLCHPENDLLSKLYQERRAYTVSTLSWWISQHRPVPTTPCLISDPHLDCIVPQDDIVDHPHLYPISLQPERNEPE